MAARLAPRSTRLDPAVRDQVLAEEPWCSDCGRPATEAGFVRPDTEGGTAERDNLTGRCRPCGTTRMISDRIAARRGRR